MMTDSFQKMTSFENAKKEIDKSTLVLFDLDNTLLQGDMDQLWCDYLIRLGLHGEEVFHLSMNFQHAYQTGIVSSHEFCNFYASLFQDFTLSACLLLREKFIESIVKPRLPQKAINLVKQHQKSGDFLLMTTASNHFLALPIAQNLGFNHLIATRLELSDEDIFTGRIQGLPNMQEAKLIHLKNWLTTYGFHQPEEIEKTLSNAYFYSDSINDLPLMSAVGHPVATNPDPRLAAEATRRQWKICQLWG
ncbi:MAG: HAD family hydrolase [Saezia sp.]